MTIIPEKVKRRVKRNRGSQNLERDRRIFKLHKEGYSLRKIALLFGISHERVNQILRYFPE